MTLFQDGKKASGAVSISPVPRGILGLDRAVALSLGAALFASVLSVAVVISDPTIAARLSGWWSGSEPTAAPAPFAYRLEKDVSILHQLAVWARHGGWELEWQALEAPPSATQMDGMSGQRPVDWPSPSTIDFGRDFDRAFASAINAMNAQRRQQGKRPLSAIADFATMRITVGFSDEADHRSGQDRNGPGDN